MGSKQATPPPVDYTAAAKQQGEENRTTSLEDWKRTHGTQSDPYKTTTTVADPTSPSGFKTVTTFDPKDQARLDQQRDLMSQLLGVGGSTIQQVQDALGKKIDTAGLPALTGNVNAEKMGRIDPNTGKNIQTDLDVSGLQSLDDPTAVRQQMMDSSYKNFSDRFDPLAERQAAALRTRQANMGGVTSSPAAVQQMQDLLTAQNDARSQAVFGAQKAGQDAAAQISAQNLANRGQQFGERTTTGQFHNAAQDQTLQQALSAMGFNNNAAQMDTSNKFTNANLANATRAQGLTEQQTMRQSSLNELMAMLSGTQVQGGNFGQQQGSNTTAAPYFQGAQGTDAQNARINAANAASGNSAMTGITSLATAAAMAF
jgi:energy-converting hydrogenase A subunit M